jgi:methionyl-tRNA formyltransferase
MIAGLEKNIRIVFMGTPEFAVASLNAILINGYDIAGIVTAPDKPAGRGNKIQMSAVKEFALVNKIDTILQPTNLKDPEFLTSLSDLKADLFIVVAFRMLPEAVWTMPQLGTINLHASLLPQYRGAAPINWAIINGEQHTGVTTFFIEKEIDTGHILMQEKVDILPEDNAGSLHDKLMEVGSKLILKTLETLKDGFYESVPQHTLKGNHVLKPAPKIFKDQCRINWDKSVLEIHNHIRGLSPYPCAWTELKGIDGSIIALKIYESEMVRFEKTEHSQNNILFSESEIKIACKDGFIKILSLQQAGKSRMSAKSFLLGFKNSGNYTLVS